MNSFEDAYLANFDNLSTEDPTSEYPDINSNASIELIIQKLKAKVFDNTIWYNTSKALKRISLLQGLPITIFSYAAGIFKSNNRFSLYGIRDLFRYISRLNILGTINIREDIVFTFLNRIKIIEGFMATYDSGLFGCAINVFMNPIDFIKMDSIIDTSNENLRTTFNNTDILDTSFDIITKINPESMAPPYYFTTDSCDNIMLDIEKIYKYKSIIYGGIDYEQFSVLLSNINKIDTKKNVYLINEPNHVFHYYIEPNNNAIKKLYNIFSNPQSHQWNYNNFDDTTIDVSLVLSDNTIITMEISNNDNGWNLVRDRYIDDLSTNSNNSYFKRNNYLHHANMKTLLSRVYTNETNHNLSLSNSSLNDLFPHFAKNILQMDYNYGNIFFLTKHNRINRAFLPNTSLNDYNFKSFVEYTVLLYDSYFDNSKQSSNNYENDLNLIFMPVEYNKNLSWHKLFEKTVRNYNHIEHSPNLQSITDTTEFTPVLDAEQMDGTKHKTKFINYRNYQANLIHPLPEHTLYYTILAGLDDTLSKNYIKLLIEINKNETGNSKDSLTNMINNVYFSFFDGNQKIILDLISENSLDIEDFRGLKKIIPFSINNLNDIPSNNILNDITNFVYNINEGAALSIDLVKNNSLSYNQGIVLGIDTILITYIAQLYHNDNRRIFKSEELHNIYINAIQGNYEINNNINNSTIENENSYFNTNYVNDRITKLNDILNSRFIINNNIVTDTKNSITYNSLYEASLTFIDEFFINVSQLLRRNINTLYQKSYYKIVEFIPPFKIDTSGSLINKKDEAKSENIKAENFYKDNTFKYTTNNHTVSTDTNLTIAALQNITTYSKDIILLNSIDHNFAIKLYNTYSFLVTSILAINTDERIIDEALITDLASELFYNSNDNILNYNNENKLEQAYKLISITIHLKANLPDIYSYNQNNDENLTHKETLLIILSLMISSQLTLNDYLKYIDNSLPNSDNVPAEEQEIINHFNTTIKLHTYMLIDFRNFLVVGNIPITLKDVLNYGTNIISINTENQFLKIMRSLFSYKITDKFVEFTIINQEELGLYNSQFIGSRSYIGKFIYTILQNDLNINNRIPDITTNYIKNFINNFINNFIFINNTINNIKIEENNYTNEFITVDNELRNIQFNNFKKFFNNN